eukprot:3540917-Prymnesium_polylepis.1
MHLARGGAAMPRLGDSIRAPRSTAGCTSPSATSCRRASTRAAAAGSSVFGAATSAASRQHVAAS